MRDRQLLSTVPALIFSHYVAHAHLSMIYVSKDSVMLFPGSAASFDVFVHAPFAITQPATCILRVVLVRARCAHPACFLGNTRSSLARGLISCDTRRQQEVLFQH